MPEFYLDMGSEKATRRFERLSEFAQGYVEAAFWLLDEEDAKRFRNGANFGHLAVKALKEMVADCDAFEKENETMLALAYASGDYTANRAGVDFWLTRNGHGAGYWDCGELTKLIVGKNNETNVGKVLTERAHVYGSMDLYRGDDGKLYV